jgi:hypothetical protein
MGIFGAELVGSDDREAQRRLSTVAATLLLLQARSSKFKL